jgi:hypothetical protein
MIQLLRQYSGYSNSWLVIRYGRLAWRAAAYYKGLLPYDGVELDRKFLSIWTEL